MRLFLAAIVLACMMPAALAQSPVYGCSRQCEPKAPDVNTPPVVEFGGAVNVIQYAHVENMLHSSPLNTIPPNASFERDVNQGFLLPAIRTKTGVAPLNIAFEHNKFTFRHCPGTIEPSDGTPNQGWRTHCHSHGIGHQLSFAAQKIPVYFYISPGSERTPSTVGALPNLQLAAQMSMGVRKDIVVAESLPGETAVTFLTGPGEPDVFELRTDMLLRVRHLDLETAGFRVDLAVYQVNEDGLEFQQPFRVRSGERFPPRIILPLIDPISFRDSVVRTDNGTIHYYLRVEADLGAYDIDAETAKARLRSGAQNLTHALRAVRVQPWDPNDHSGATNPLMFHYAIDTRGIDVDGPLTFEFSVANQQGTYIMHHATLLPFAKFQGAEEIPTPSALGLLVLALGALFARRRR